MSTLHRIAGCDDDARRADVVFIHGLGGDAFATWRHGADASTSWPHWLGEAHPEVGVWSLGYAASPTRLARVKAWFTDGSRDAGHAMPLPDRGLQVLDLMVQRGLGQRPILFVCHSLGGLVAKQVLRRSADADDAGRRSVAEATRAVLFLATPHAGAALATMLDAFRTVFGTTVSIEDLRAHDAHLRDLGDWYRDNAGRLGVETAAYFEWRTIGGVKIVDPTSANPGVGAAPVGLDEDHLSIAKPRDRDAQVCGAAGKLLLDHVLGKSKVPLAAFPTGSVTEDSSPHRVPLMQLLENLADENRKLKDEIDQLRTSESERVQLRLKLEAVQTLLASGSNGSDGQ